MARASGWSFGLSVTETSAVLAGDIESASSSSATATALMGRLDLSNARIYGDGTLLDGWQPGLSGSNVVQLPTGTHRRFRIENDVDIAVAVKPALLECGIADVPLPSVSTLGVEISGAFRNGDFHASITTAELALLQTEVEQAVAQISSTIDDAVDEGDEVGPASRVFLSRWILRLDTLLVNASHNASDLANDVDIEVPVGFDAAADALKSFCDDWSDQAKTCATNLISVPAAAAPSDALALVRGLLSGIQEFRLTSTFPASSQRIEVAGSLAIQRLGIPLFPSLRSASGQWRLGRAGVAAVMFVVVLFLAITATAEDWGKASVGALRQPVVTVLLLIPAVMYRQVGSEAWPLSIGAKRVIWYSVFAAWLSLLLPPALALLILREDPTWFRLGAWVCSVLLGLYLLLVLLQRSGFAANAWAKRAMRTLDEATTPLAKI